MQWRRRQLVGISVGIMANANGNASSARTHKPSFKNSLRICLRFKMKKIYIFASAMPIGKTFTSCNEINWLFILSVMQCIHLYFIVCTLYTKNEPSLTICPIRWSLTQRARKRKKNTKLNLINEEHQRSSSSVCRAENKLQFIFSANELCGSKWDFVQFRFPVGWVKNGKRKHRTSFWERRQKKCDVSTTSDAHGGFKHQFPPADISTAALP